MADQDTPTTETTSTDKQTNSRPPEDEQSRRTRRPVYEPTLLTGRKRRRASPWIVIPTLLVALGAILYVVLVLPKNQRFVPTAGELVYSSDQGSPGHPHLWIESDDGASAHRLTTREPDETSPAWSPDGSQIAFVSAQKDGDPQIFVVDADGRDLAQVTQNSGAKSQPQFAPSDNRLIGFLSGGSLNTVDIATGQTQRLLPVVTAPARDKNSDSGLTVNPATSITSFSWLPSSDLEQMGIAAVEDTAGVQGVILLPTLTSKPISTHANGSPLAAAENVSVAWSPDGGLLAVALMGAQGPQQGREISALILLDSQGNISGQRPLAIFPTGALGPQHPVFTPDGARVVAEVWDGSDLAHEHSVGLLSAPVDGSSPGQPLYKGAAIDPRFSRDGKTMYFLKDGADGRSQICKIGVDGSGFKAISSQDANTTAFVLSPQAKSGT